MYFCAIYTNNLNISITRYLFYDTHNKKVKNNNNTYIIQVLNNSWTNNKIENELELLIQLSYLIMYSVIQPNNLVSGVIV